MSHSARKISVRTDGPAIRHARLLKGWTQSALAARAGVSKRTVETAEAGGSLNATSVDAICGSLGLVPADLIHCLPSSNPQPFRMEQDLLAGRITPAPEILNIARTLAEHRSPDSVAQAVQLVEPIAHEKSHPAVLRAEAYAVLSDLMIRRAVFDTASRSDVNRSVEYAHEAVALAPTHWEGHAQLGISVATADFDWREAGRHLTRAQELNPNAPYLTVSASIVNATQGQFRTAITDIRHALAHRLGNQQGHRQNLPQFLYMARDYHDAVTEAKLTKALYPQLWTADVFVALSEQARGSSVRAAGAILLSAWGQGKNEMHHVVSQIKKTLSEHVQGKRSENTGVRLSGRSGDIGDLLRMAMMGQRDNTLRLLDSLYQRRHPMSTWFVWMPIFDFVRATPAMRDLTHAMGIPQAQDPDAWLANNS